MGEADENELTPKPQPQKIIYLNETETTRQIGELLTASGFDVRPEIVRLIIAYHTNHLENIGLIRFIKP